MRTFCVRQAVSDNPDEVAEGELKSDSYVCLYF